MTLNKVICPYCEGAAKLVSGRVIYPHRPDLFKNNFWTCPPCKAHVGCHRPNIRHGFTGEEPLGRLANAEENSNS